jgi:hypothetical protein
MRELVTPEPVPGERQQDRGNKLAGFPGGFFDPQSPATMLKLYGGIAAGHPISAENLAPLTPQIKKPMGSGK